MIFDHGSWKYQAQLEVVGADDKMPLSDLLPQ
jgi:hypothetical protein